MSGHEVPERPAPYSDRPLGAGSAREATKPHRDGLGARYVAVRYSAMYYERAARRWRRLALAAGAVAGVAIAALVVVLLNG